MTHFDLLCLACLAIEPEGFSMKLVITLLGLALIVIAAVYFLLSADQLPSFFPGHETGLARIRMKHGLVSGGAGVVLLAVGWWLGRKS
jgi:hypothetical protein